MSLWGDLFGDTEIKQENLLSGQQENAMSQMGQQANRLQDIGMNLKPIDVTDPAFQRRYSNYSNALQEATNTRMKDAMHSNKIHSSANMLRRAGIQQGADMQRGNLEQQNLEQQLRASEQAKVNNEYLRRQYLNSANQLRGNIVNKRAINNQVEKNSGLYGNVLGLGGMIAQTMKMFGG